MSSLSWSYHHTLLKWGITKMKDEEDDSEEEEEEDDDESSY